MKTVYKILFLLLIASCSAVKTYDRGISKIAKAIEKDPALSLPKDTIVTIHYDTILGEDGKTIFITIEKEVPGKYSLADLERAKENAKGPKRYELRFFKKMYNDSMKNNRKFYELETERILDSFNFQRKLNVQLTRQLKSANKKDQNVSKYENKSSPVFRFIGKFWWVVAIIFFGLGIYSSRFIPSFK